MNNLPREKLREIVEKYGQSAVDDARRCHALLLDFCGKHRREIFVLTTAQEELVAEDLQEIPNSLPLSVLVAQLAQRLVDNRALDENAARWAVETWAYALGMDVDSLSKTTPPSIPASKPKPTPNPVSKTTPAVVVSKRAEDHTYTSKYTVDVYSRPRADETVKFQRLGTTPGTIVIPHDHVIGLRPTNLPKRAFSDWVNEIAQPLDVTSVSLRESVTDDDLFSLGKLPSITYLDITRGTNLTDQGLNHLTHLPNLITLKLAWCPNITDDGMAYLQALVKLNHLSLAWSNISDGALPHLRRLTQLTVLVLRECKRIYGNGLAHLKDLPRLTTLELPRCTRMSNAGLRYIGTLTKLRKLDLSHCPEIRRGIVYLRALYNLRYLDLAGNSQIGDGEMAPLCSLSALSSLNLSRSHITNRGLGHVGDIFNLIYLDLSYCEGINDGGLKQLRHLDKLVILNLSNCPNVTSRGVGRLQQPGLTILR